MFGLKRIIKYLTIAAAFLVILIPGNCRAQAFPKSPQPWRNEYNITLDDFHFTHPLTVINQNDLSRVKQRIQENIEPQVSAFQDLLIEAELQLDFEPDAPLEMNIMGGYESNSNLIEMRAWLWRNGHAAYTCALAYAYTDESKYAEKARNIIMDWANTYTTFTGLDRGLQLGSWFSQMLYAADLIWNYAAFTPDDKAQLGKWIRNKWLDEGAVLNVMRTRDDNWKDAGILGVMTASVILEDSLLLKEALIQLESYFFTRTDSYVEYPGPGWKIKKDQKGVYLPREVIRNEGSSGITYTAYALTTMVQCLEIARYAGFDYWYDSTEEKATIKDVIEQYYAWDIGNENFPWHSSPQKMTKRRNCYELANTRFVLDKEMQIWIRDNRPLSGREGDEWSTLNKGATIESTLGDIQDEIEKPGFSLDQNCPNPFNHATEIIFRIPERNHTSLVVNNSMGQPIQKLADEEMNPGSCTISFIASHLPEGLYFYKLVSGPFSQVRKMVIIP